MACGGSTRPGDILDVDTSMIKIYGKKDFTLLLEDISKLTNLSVIIIMDAKLTAVPEFICSSTKLVELYLAGNKITSIPKSLSALTNLRRLDLSENNLTVIPKVIFSLVKLGFLNLDNNNIQFVPESLLSLTNLWFISLKGNPLSPFTLCIERTDFHHLHSRRNFLKCYFALTLNCSFPVIESILTNTHK
jgi:Leucine-rich repeat (LRR) protein